MSLMICVFFCDIFYRIKTYASDSDESDTETVDVDKLPPLEVSELEHKLQYTYCLWYHRGSYKIKTPLVSGWCSIDSDPFKNSSEWKMKIKKIKYFSLPAQDYSKSLHLIGRCGSVEQWWSLYCRLIKPSQLKPYRELHLFKSGIKPMWEDPGNANGGKWVIRLRKNKIDRAWENVCMAMLGEQFLVGPEICGVVLSTRFPVSTTYIYTRERYTPTQRLWWISAMPHCLFYVCFVCICRKTYYPYGIEVPQTIIVQIVFGIRYGAS